MVKAGQIVEEGIDGILFEEVGVLINQLFVVFNKNLLKIIDYIEVVVFLLSCNGIFFRIFNDLFRVSMVVFCGIVYGRWR